MTDERNGKGQFVPLHEAHAIERLLIVVQFSGQLDDADLAQVKRAGEQFPELPGVTELQTFTVTVGQIAPPAAPNQLSGVSFRAVSKQGTTETELRVDRSSLVFRTSIYTRWDEVWGQARRYFAELVPIFAARGVLSGVALNFVDKFVWTGQPDESRGSMLLREASPFVAPHVFSAEDLWHSHFGKFVRVDNKVKRLLNVNLDCLNEEPAQGLRRVISITTVATDMFNQPGFEQLALGEGATVGDLHKRLDELHDYIKKVFAEVIGDRMTKRIALLD
jgi:uncharacterized protein (TIGR04255 family)